MNLDNDKHAHLGTYRESSTGREASVYERKTDGFIIVQTRTTIGEIEERDYDPRDYEPAKLAKTDAREYAVSWTRAATSNTEFLAHIMGHAKTGPLMQAVVMHALAYYVGKAAQMPAEKFDSAGLSGTAWLECVHELEAALNERLEG